jgi:phage replication-related protein YjqB (UPF0714/DUF867 family)
MDIYACYADLANAEREGIDFERIERPVPAARVAVIAPHGGGIEPRSEEIAAAIAGDEFSFYCFRGCKPKNNGSLHITSHRFDEPGCLAMLAQHTWVVAIHGCNEPGETVYIGGLDAELIEDLADAIAEAGISVTATGHDYPGMHPDNICNRGASAKGAQFELTPDFRNGGQIESFVAAVRSVLAARHAKSAAQLS